MTSTRYVLTPDPGTILDDYVQAAIAAITAISGRPLDSLDAIPERLRYLFREEVVLQCGTGGSGPTSPGAGGCAKVVTGPIKDLKVSLTGDVVKADDLGWIDTFKTAATEDEDDSVPADLLAAIKGYHDGPLSDEHVRTLMGYVRQYGAERDAARNKLRQWMESHPPSICSAHQRVRLDCRVCNPALAMLETARTEIAALRASSGEF